jgi:hypothetical protein
MINVNQITAQMARMSDQALQQYAAMHKADPYTLSLALSESNRRKEMRQGAQAGAPQQQPKVVDQEIAQMGPQMAPPQQGMPPQGAPQGMPPQQLPEDSGIGQLPAPNMQRMAEGGIVAFEEGGEVPGYDKGGVTKDDPFDAAFRRVMRYEGGYVANDAGKGPSKFGINKAANPDLDIAKLTEKDAKRIYRERYWDKIGGDELAKKNPALATVAFDTAVNMGVTPAKRLVEQSGGDPSKILAAREQHYASLIEKDPKKFAPYQSGWQSRLADLATSVFPSAAAAELPRKTDEGLASLIPGQTAQAPPKAPEGGFLSPDSFQRGAEAVGLPRDVGRQAYTTLMAPTPLAPASMVPKSGPGILGGLEKLGEKLYGKVAPGKNMTEAQIAAAKAEMAAAARTGGQEQRLLTGPQAKLPGPTTPVTPAGQGITDLVAPGARMVPVAEDASRLEKMAQASNLEKLRKAQEGVGEGAAATQPAQTAARFAQEAGPASAAEKIQAASIAREAEHAAQVGAAANQAQAAKTGLATLAAGATAVGNMGEDFNMGKNLTPLNPEEFGKDTGQMPVEMPAPKEIKEIGKEATPKSERKGMSGEDFLMIGLGILSGQSPNALTNIGEGGLKGLQMVQAGRKNEAEAAYRDAMSKYYGAGTEAIERGSKDKDLIGAAEKSAHDAFTAMAKDNIFLMTNPEERAKLYNRLRMEKFAQYGISPTILGGAGNKYSPADMALVDKYANT